MPVPETYPNKVTKTDFTNVAKEVNLKISTTDANAAYRPLALSGALVKRTVAQSVPNDAPTVINWDAEVWDTAAFHDTVTNNTRLTIPTGRGGYYLLFGTLQYATTTGVCQARFNKNGVLLTPQGIASAAAATGGVVATHTTVVPLVAADYVEMAAYQNSGGASDVAPTLSSFGLYFLGT